VWHKNGVMAPVRKRRERPPLDRKKLEELALRYVERFATTRGKLRDYLRRKLNERGWEGESEPDFEAIGERFAELGYVDDAAYALSKARSLAGRGYGKRRLVQKLRGAGVEESDAEAARAHADDEAVASALRFAERRRLGPFALTPARDPRDREKALAAMVRAGHGFELARAIIALAPGTEIDLDQLPDRAGLPAN
jgi:regulatory protein